MPDESWETRQISGLLRSFADQERELGSYETRLDGLDRELAKVHQTRREDVTVVTSAIKDVRLNCDRSVNNLRKEIKTAADEAKQTAADAKKEAMDNRRNVQLTRFQSIGLFIAACSPVLTSISLIVLGK